MDEEARSDRTHHRSKYLARRDNRLSVRRETALPHHVVEEFRRGLEEGDRTQVT